MPSPTLVLLLATRRGRASTKRWLVAAAAAVMLLALMTFLLISGAGSAASTPCPTSTPRSGDAPLDQDARANAQVIADVGIKAGVGTRGVTVALATAMQESGLRNLSYGDRDSLGLFQQRPSAGWGTPTQVRTPALAAAAFYGVASHTRNTGLTQIGGWQQMSITAAAQAVQKSAYPEAYAQWESQAAALAAELVGQVPSSTPSPGSGAGSSSAQCYGGVGPEVSGDWANPLAAGYSLTSPFGMRFHPIEHTWRLHDGQDMAEAIGTPIYAACNGVVTSAGDSGGSGGLVTTIDCGGGVATSYKHQSRTGALPGQRVRAGDPIGFVGNTGGSTGPHLHFQLEIGGTPTDPVPFMASRGVRL